MLFWVARERKGGEEENESDVRMWNTFFLILNIMQRKTQFVICFPTAVN